MSRKKKKLHLRGRSAPGLLMVDTELALATLITGSPALGRQERPLVIAAVARDLTGGKPELLAEDPDGLVGAMRRLHDDGLIRIEQGRAYPTRCDQLAGMVTK